MNAKMSFIFVLLYVFATGHNPTKADIGKVEALLNSAHEKALNVDAKSTRIFAMKALKISKQTGYFKGEVWSNFYIAQGLSDLLAYKQSLYYLRNAEEINDEIVEDKYLSFQIRRTRSIIYTSMRNFNGAVHEQKKGLEIIDEIPPEQNQNRNLLKGIAYENLAVIFDKKGNKEYFFEYLKKSKQLLEKQNSVQVFKNLISLYTLFGNYYAAKNQFPEAESYFKKSEDLGTIYNFPEVSFTYQNWGDMELKRKSIKSAIVFYNKACVILEKTNIRSQIPEIYKKLSVAYESLGLLQESKDYKLKYLQSENHLKTEQLNALYSTVEETSNNRLEKENQNVRKIVLIFLGSILVVVIAVFVKVTYNKNRNVILRENQKFLKEIEITKPSDRFNITIEEIIHLAKNNSPEFLFCFQWFYPELIKEIMNIRLVA